MHCVYKPPGKTPYDIITLLKHNNPTLAGVPLAYAGRLDPLAEGLLLILEGHECKHRNYYQKLDKIYEFTLLLGIATDTYDPMGIITNVYSLPLCLSDYITHVTQLLVSYKGSYEQAYPPYSSARLHGKPLYYWARRGELSSLSIPTHMVTIHEIIVLNGYELSYEDLVEQATQRIHIVRGDFRQEAIITQWRKGLPSYRNHQFPLIRMRVMCSSGTYVRSIAHTLGQELGVGGLAWHIRRTHVGTYSLSDMVSNH